jgi:hypothetical protein
LYSCTLLLLPTEIRRNHSNHSNAAALSVPICLPTCLPHAVPKRQPGDQSPDSTFTHLHQHYSGEEAPEFARFHIVSLREYSELLSYSIPLTPGLSSPDTADRPASDDALLPTGMLVSTAIISARMSRTGCSMLAIVASYLGNRPYLWNSLVVDVDQFSWVRVDLQCAVKAEGCLYRVGTWMHVSYQVSLHMQLCALGHIPVPCWQSASP